MINYNINDYYSCIAGTSGHVADDDLSTSTVVNGDKQRGSPVFTGQRSKVCNIDNNYLKVNFVWKTFYLIKAIRMHFEPVFEPDLYVV